MLKLQELAAILQLDAMGCPDVDVTSVSIDTREIEQGALFVAIAGDVHDGHDYIDMAAERGAVAALVSKEISAEIPCLCVPDTVAALGELAAAWRQHFDCPVLALTGSCGKTTVKEMVAAIMRHHGEVLAPVHSFNNNIGVPLTLLRWRPEHDYVVCELGANHPGEIAYLTQMVKPTVAFINNIAPAHLEGFGSIDGVAEAKSEIYQGLAVDGVALLNLEDDYAEFCRDKIAATDRRYITFGLTDKADIYATDIQSMGVSGSQFELVTSLGRQTVKIGLLGQHNVLNAVAASAAAIQLGASLSAVAAGLADTQAVQRRLHSYYSPQGAHIIDDSYNANPRSVRAAIDVLSAIKGKRILVFGNMGELGEDAELLHREIGEYAKAAGINGLYACGELAGLAAEAFGVGGQNFATKVGLIQALQAEMDSGVTALVKGSKIEGMNEIVRALVDEEAAVAAEI